MPYQWFISVGLRLSSVRCDSIMDIFIYSILLLFFSMAECSKRSIIPNHLLDCYTEPAPLLLPMTADTLVEIVRKINVNSFPPVSLSQQAADLLHWFSLEGLERDPNVVLRLSHLVPYQRSEMQTFKHDLLLEKLIPVKHRVFDAYSLSISEKCTLHAMMSSTVNFWERGDEMLVCPNSYQEFRGPESEWDIARLSSCPVEQGVIHVAGGGGSVSVGRVVAGVAAALAPQRVALAQLTTEPDYTRTPGGRIINTWAVTLAGDLAEAAVSQVSEYNEVSIGLAGQWNDTFIPTVYYFHNIPYSDIERHNWQITDAKILGGIDGLLLGRIAVSLKDRMHGLQLSQLLDMYYLNSRVSEEGHVCNREQAFTTFLSENGQSLIQQTQYLADVLSSQAHYPMNSSMRKERCIQTVGNFLQYYPHLLKARDCPKKTPSNLNLKLIYDASWTPYTKLQFIMSLMEQVDINHYGGRIAIINGDSSNIKLNSTSNPLSVFQDTVLNKSEEPRGLVIRKSLLAIQKLIEGDNVREQQQLNSRKARQDVVVVLGHSSTISDKDINTARDILKVIKSQNPAVRFVYWTSHVNAPTFVQLTAMARSQLDTILATDNSRVDLLLPKLQYSIQSGSRDLKPAYCKNDSHQWPESSYEEYISPDETISYRIHPDYLHDSLDIVKILFKNHEYGTLQVCMSRSTDEVGDCKDVGEGQGVTHALLRPCRQLMRASASAYQWDPGCPPIYFTVHVKQSYNRCTETDCRYPDQVKFSIIVQDLHCVNLNSPVYSSASFIISNFGFWTLFIVTIFYLY